jgi:hypothetical protein
MMDVQTTVQALQEAELFRMQVGEFGTDMARQMAMDPKMSPCKNYSPTTSSYSYIGIFCLHTCFAHAAARWMLFGSSTLNLTKLALRLVSQCCSSSGCERNWSTFALLHTKVRNHLSHKKLNKLVYMSTTTFVCDLWKLLALQFMTKVISLTDLPTFHSMSTIIRCGNGWNMVGC